MQRWGILLCLFNLSKNIETGGKTLTGPYLVFCNGTYFLIIGVTSASFKFSGNWIFDKTSKSTCKVIAEASTLL